MKNIIIAVLLSFLACIKVVADLFQHEELSAVAAVANVSPAMKVFTAHQGYETYSAKFKLTMLYADGTEFEAILDSERYAGLAGPYNRRNVYGALIAYGPVLYKKTATHDMWVEMTRRAFCQRKTVMSELNFPIQTAVTKVTVSYINQISADTAADYPTQLSIRCDNE